ncbi:MAG: CDP-diacylglycerol--serine O-phosphatidyltransferase [Nitrospirota bacterium]
MSKRKRRLRDAKLGMKKGIYILPSFLTIISLFCGFYAIVSAIKGNFESSAWAIMVASLFDMLDGWVARATHSTTRFGIELDSLSDVVAFGVAPAMLAYMWALIPFGRFGWAAAFLFVVCGALRLARFNIQMGSSESKHFTGLPIPAAAITVATLVLFYEDIWDKLYGKNYLIIALVYLLAFLMVSTIKYHGVKEMEFKKRKPFWILVISVLILAVIVIHPPVMLFVFSMAYIIWGIVEEIISYPKRKELEETPQEEVDSRR